MKKLSLFLLLLLLAACGPGAAPANEQAVSNTEDTAVPAASTTSVTEATAVPVTAVPTAALAEGTTITPAATAAEAAVVRPEDWVTGATDPLVSIIEYGDFQ